MKRPLAVPTEVVFSFASVELGAYVREKNIHADAMVGSDPLSVFRVSNREQLRLRDQLAADGASPAGHRECMSLAWDCSDFGSASLRELIGNVVVGSMVFFGGCSSSHWRLRRISSCRASSVSTRTALFIPTFTCVPGRVNRSGLYARKNSICKRVSNFLMWPTISPCQ